MSGGYFNYIQYDLVDAADKIMEVVDKNDSDELDEYGDPVGKGYTRETIAKFLEAARALRRSALMLQRVDWLVSGDDSEENFHKRWREEVPGGKR
jgi:hypothetical protein